MFGSDVVFGVCSTRLTVDIHFRSSRKAVAFSSFSFFAETDIPFVHLPPVAHYS